MFFFVCVCVWLRRNYGGTDLLTSLIVTRKFTSKLRSRQVSDSNAAQFAVILTLKSIVKDVDIIILSITLKGVPLLPKDLFDGVPKHIIIIDTCNYYPIRDGYIEALENGVPESVWVSEQLGRPVIKAFNNILAYSLVHLGLHESTQGRIALPVAGDDLNAKKIAMGLVNEAGFDAVDSGTLSDSWRQHPGTPVYGTDLQADKIPIVLSAANRELAPKLRELVLQKMETLRLAVVQVNQESGYTLKLSYQELIELGGSFVNDLRIAIFRSTQMEPLLNFIK